MQFGVDAENYTVSTYFKFIYWPIMFKTLSAKLKFSIGLRTQIEKNQYLFFLDALAAPKSNKDLAQMLTENPGNLIDISLLTRTFT